MFLYVMSLVGVAVFAASGALAAGLKGYDLMGVAVRALVTALGGGTMRDLLLDRHPIVWMSDTAYLWVALGAAAAMPLYVRWFRPPDKTLLLADAVGLALFTINGAQLAEQQGLSGIQAVLMGVCTGVAGGVLRDVLARDTPLLFSAAEPLYATAAIIGASLYLALEKMDISTAGAAVLGMAVIAGLRFAAIFWDLRLPAFHVGSQER